MREAHPLVKRVAETLDLGDDEDLFGRDDGKPVLARKATAEKSTTSSSLGDSEEPSFGDALRGLLGSTTAGSTG